MNKKEKEEVNETLYHIYCGILFHHLEFYEGEHKKVVYKFDCPEYKILKQRYDIETIAKEGSDFHRAVRLLHFLSPRLKHQSDYDNHITCNSLDLLDYCFEKKNVGINCLNKAKILEECCLSLGIYARRVRLFPYSIYDFDSHVVTEIYDRDMEKWIMLDPSTDGYFIDEQQMPLSCKEIRDKFAYEKMCSVIFPNQTSDDLEALFLMNIEENAYYAKNMFCFMIDECSTFGEEGDCFIVIPQNYSFKEYQMNNYQYRLSFAKKKHLSQEIITLFENKLNDMKDKVYSFGNIEHLWDKPK